MVERIEKNNDIDFIDMDEVEVEEKEIKEFETQIEKEIREFVETKVMEVIKNKFKKKIRIRKYKNSYNIIIPVKYPYALSLDEFQKIIDTLITYGFEPYLISTTKNGILLRCERKIENMALYYDLMKAGIIR